MLRECISDHGTGSVSVHMSVRGYKLTKGGLCETVIVLVIILHWSVGTVIDIQKDRKYSDDVLVCFHGDDREPPDLGNHSHLYERIQPTRNKLPGKSCFTASRKVPARVKRSSGYTPSKIDDHEIQHAFGRHDGVAFVNQLEYLRRELRYAGNDPKWADLWFLNDVTPSMRVPEAWEYNTAGYSGSGVTIAVLDNGVDLDHYDLDDNLNLTLGYDFFNSDSDPNPISILKTHGTLVAGIIAAIQNNGNCVTGIAYQAKIAPVLLLGDSYTTDLIEGEALMHKLDNIDIYSNSWGPPGQYGYSTLGDFAKAAILKGITEGRGGKGAIYVFAAGNSGTQDNCNADEYANSIYTITISSLGSNGVPAEYAEVCPPALAVGYGGDDTTGKYVLSTGTSDRCMTAGPGTSFSAPQASAIIALALQANPNLTWRDVQHLLVLTSKDEGITEGLYGWQKNGQGKKVSQLMGFGLLDAEAMVTEAVSWVTVPNVNTVDVTSTHSKEFVSSATPSITQTLNVASGDVTYLEHVAVQVVAKCNNRKDLSLTLASAKGTESRLMTTRKYDTAVDEVDFTFTSVQFWGEVPQGSWTLTLGCSGDAGYLTSWVLRLHGISDTPDSLKGRNYCSTCAASSTSSCTELWYGHDCVCVAGFDGELCDNNIDDCAVNPCSNNGRCVDGISSYTCDCASTGYTGDTCTEDIDECVLYNNPCQNGSPCVNGVNDYTCDCTDTGYEGKNCSSDIDKCQSNPCQNGGTCVKGVAAFSCECDFVHGGITCEKLSQAIIIIIVVIVIVASVVAGAGILFAVKKYSAKSLRKEKVFPELTPSIEEKSRPLSSSNIRVNSWVREETGRSETPNLIVTTSIQDMYTQNKTDNLNNGTIQIPMVKG